MGIAHYIKEIGRGKDGARPLSETQAYDLFSQVLDAQVSDLEVGAFCVAMRIKGETTEELAGFLRATHERCNSLNPPSTAVLLPSYNGARKLPNLTPLLAAMLADQGIPVLVHGPRLDPMRVTSAQIFQGLGWITAHTAAEVEAAWSHQAPVYMSIDDLCPPLARLLSVRQSIGLRNPGHTIAKLLDPTPGQSGLRVVNYTHPEYALAHHAFLRHAQVNALLMRGTEGEPVADPRRQPKFDIFVHGEVQPRLSQPAQEGILGELPVLPRSIDAASTAVYIQGVRSGVHPAPLPLQQQTQCLRTAIATLQSTQLSAVS